MQVYKSVYDAMLSRAFSYGYIEQQVLDILSESYDRVELNTYKNIPDGERYWMAERWTWETLFADELNAFPGEKPKWKGAANYLKHKSPAAEETPKNNEGEASGDSPASTEVKVTPSTQFRAWQRIVSRVKPNILGTAPKSTGRSLVISIASEVGEDSAIQEKPPKSSRKRNSSTKAPKTPTSIPILSPASGANKRKRTEPQSGISDNSDSPKLIPRPYARSDYFSDSE
ncbi:hypothetical protein EAF04_006834 [Stromatinia cepivora]|nr:hypothetical protein EAF04_006834 [Stromatinia cepivora]